MRGKLLVLGVAVAGVLIAASLGFAAYLVSRDSVGLPVTKLDPAPRKLVPKTTTARRPTARATGTTQTQARTQPRATSSPTTTDDHGGRGRGRSGSDNSGPGGGGGGGDDD